MWSRDRCMLPREYEKDDNTMKDGGKLCIETVSIEVTRE